MRDKIYQRYLIITGYGRSEDQIEKKNRQMSKEDTVQNLLQHRTWFKNKH